MVGGATRAAAVVPGGVDWAARWRELVENREAGGPGGFEAGGSRWEGRADRFARPPRSVHPTTDPFVQALLAELQPADHVLDIGAGAGRYSLPIASRVARVT